jgi:hypothetical protein
VKRGLFDQLAYQLGCSPKAAEGRAARAHAILPQVVAAARTTEDRQWLASFFAESDALRLGETMRFEIWMGVTASHKDTVEDERFVRWLADQGDAAAFDAWIRALEDEVTDKLAVLAAAKAAR